MKRLVRFFGVVARRPFAVVGVALALSGFGLIGRYIYFHWQFERHLENARRAEERFDFEDARNHLAECIRLQSHDAELHLRMGRDARRLGDYSAAQAEIDAYQKMAAGPTSEGELEQAMLLAQQGELPVAESFLRERLREKDSRTPLILEALARGGVRVYRLPEALRWAEELLAIQPGNVLALLVQGMIHESNGHADKALERFQTALDYQPEYAEARLQLAETLLRLKRPSEALEHLERLRAAHPSREATLALARCYRLLGRLDEATPLLRELAAERPEDGAVLAESGRTALAADRLAEAEDALRRAVLVLPADRAANFDLAACLQRRGKQTEAEHYRERGEQIQADLKQLAEAADKAMQSPSDPQPRLRAGLICLRNGQDRQGLRWMFGALQVDPVHRPTHEALAAYYQQRGQTPQAVYHRRQAR